MRLAKLGTAAGAAATSTALVLSGCTSGTDANVTVQVAEGVTYEALAEGDALVHLLTVDLALADVDVLTPGAVAAAAKPTDMAKDAGAVAVVNGDFFNNDADDNSVGHTDAPVGPAISDGGHLTSAVPEGQLMGPERPSGAEVDSVFGVTADGRATVSTLTFAGQVSTPEGDFDLDGLNQYAIAEDGIGVFTPDWGDVPRLRAVCGSDTQRAADCSQRVREVAVADGEVAAVTDAAGVGAVPDGEVALLARDDGAAELDALDVGDPVELDYGLEPAGGEEFDVAVGGMPLVVDGEPLLDESGDLEPRTAVGHSADGETVYMAVVDGRSEHSEGADLASLAAMLADAGAHGVVNLDGGGSSVMGTASELTFDIRSNPSGRLGERAVANALGVFAAPAVDDGSESESEELIEFLEGRWEHRGDFPTDVRSLLFDGEGNAVYHTEGMPVDYRGAVEAGAAGSDWTFTLEMEQSEPTGPDAELQTLTLNISADPDDEVLLVDVDGHEADYHPAEAD